MRPHSIIACASVVLLTAMPALAQDVERYQLERTDAGYVRLDTVTGRMSICEERAGQLVCKVAVEEREAYDRDFDALQKRVDALEERLAGLEQRRPAADMPTEEEFEQSLGYMEKFFRRFMGIVEDLERNLGTDEPQPDADRT